MTQDPLGTHPAEVQDEECPPSARKIPVQAEDDGPGDLGSQGCDAPSHPHAGDGLLRNS